MRKAIVFSLFVVSLSSSRNVDAVAQDVAAYTLELRKFLKTGGIPFTPRFRELLSKRQALMLQLVSEDPARAVSLALPDTDLRMLRTAAAGDAALSSSIEERGSWSGRVDLIYDDGRDNRLHFFLAAENRRLELFFDDPRRACMQHGDVISIEGIRASNNIAVARATIAEPRQTSPNCSPVGEQRIAVLLLHFPGVSHPSITVDELREVFFGAELSYSRHLREASYGKAWATGDVFGPYELDRAYSCNQFVEIRQAALSAFGAENARRYNRFFIYFTDLTGGCNFGSGCEYEPGYSVTWEGISPPLPGAPEPQLASLVGIAVHEGGHNLGLGHARAVDFGLFAVGPPGQTGGTIDEYGDWFSPMGKLSYAHFSAPEKLYLGWLTPDDVLTVEDATTFTLAPLSDVEGRPKAARIRRAQGIDAWFWLEYRQRRWPLEYDLRESAFSGAIIRYEDPGLSPGNPFSFSGPMLLDFTPESTTGFRTADVGERLDFIDAPLAAGRTWADAFTSRTIRVEEAAPYGLRVTVGTLLNCISLMTSEYQHGPGEEVGLVPISAPPGCEWAAAASAPWIGIESQTQGIASGQLEYRVRPNTAAQARTGWITVGTSKVSITQSAAASGAPVVVGLTPRQARGPYAKLRALYGHTDGVDELAVLRFTITTGADPADVGNSCVVEFDVVSGRQNDNIDAKRCVPQTSVSRIDSNGEELLALDAMVALVGDTPDVRHIFLGARDKKGVESGWKLFGGWTFVPNTAPTVSLTPQSGSGTQQVFTISASDANGSEDIDLVVLTIAAGSQQCSATYWRSLGLLQLQGSPLSIELDRRAPSVIEGPNCSLETTKVIATGKRDGFEVRFPLTFKTTFSGPAIAWAFVRDRSGVSKGTLGSWTIGPGLLPAPRITVEGVTNAASFVRGPLAPGEIVAIFGERLGPPTPTLAGWNEGVLESAVAGTEVFFDDTRAPLIYTSAGQVNAIVPYSVWGSTRMRVVYEGRSSNELVLPVAAAAPGIFQHPGTSQAVVVNQDGKLNADTPARRGSIITLFVTGDGWTKPWLIEGQAPVGPPWPAPFHSAVVHFGDVIQSSIDFAGLVWAGVLQMNVRIPEQAPTGAFVPLRVAFGGSASPDGPTLRIE